AAVGRRRPDAAAEQRRRERQRVVAVAVRVFRHEQIIADQQRRLHGTRGNIERLEQEGADDERDDERVENQAPRVGNSALLFLCQRGAAHWPLIHLLPRARRRRRIGGPFRLWKSLWFSAG